jgi:hypothetical protein
LLATRFCGQTHASPETSEVFQSLSVWEVKNLEILRCFAVFDK